MPHYNVSILHTVRQIHTSIHLAAISLRGNLTSRQSRTSVAYSVSLCFRTREIAPTFPAQRRTSSDRCEAEKSSELNSATTEKLQAIPSLEKIENSAGWKRSKIQRLLLARRRFQIACHGIWGLSHQPLMEIESCILKTPWPARGSHHELLDEE